MLKKRILALLIEIGEIDDEINSYDMDLIETDVLDSLIIAQLIGAIEEEFNIEEIDAEDINEDNFKSINSIVKLLRKYGLED